MDLIALLKKIDINYSIKKRETFIIPIEKQRSFLYSLPEPNDDFQRSYYQYLCSMIFKGRVIRFFLNMFSMPVSWWVTKTFLKKKINRSCVCDAVFLPDGKSDDIIPKSLKAEFKNIVMEEVIDHCLLKEDITYIESIKKKYPGVYFFYLKVTVKLARYRCLIERYRPKALIVCNEYSFTSSIMRDFCEKNNVELINIMHGEKWFFIRDSFFHYDRCYAWDEFYVRLFVEMRAYKGQFIIERPDSFNIEKVDIRDKTIDFTYYLQDESGKDLDKILNSLSRLKEKNYNIAVRPHPRFSDRKLVMEKMQDILEVEDTRTFTIQGSLKRTRNAISLGSTVLNQAYYNDIPIIIDDITKPKEYEYLKSMKYIMMTKPHRLLSEII